MFLGFILIALGILFLLQNIGVLNETTWSIVWPILIIALGLSLVCKRGKGLI